MQPVGLWKGSWEQTLAGPGSLSRIFPSQRFPGLGLHQALQRAHNDTLYLKVRMDVNVPALEAVQSDLHFVCIQAYRDLISHT